MCRVGFKSYYTVLHHTVSSVSRCRCCVCRFNEMAKSAGGETGKAAQTRALLFDMTFLMLVHIIQLYGLEV